MGAKSAKNTVQTAEYIQALSALHSSSPGHISVTRAGLSLMNLDEQQMHESQKSNVLIESVHPSRRCTL